MKKTLLITLTILFTITLFTFVFPSSVYGWTTSNVSLSNISVTNNSIIDFKISFEVPDYLGEATSWICVQSNTFEDEDFTNFGAIANTYNFENIDAMNANDTFKTTYGILGFSPNDTTGFPCFGEDYYEISRDVSVSGIPLDIQKTYYVYLWTRAWGFFYPDALIATIDFDGSGNVTVKDSAGNDGLVIFKQDITGIIGSDVTTYYSGLNVTPNITIPEGATICYKTTKDGTYTADMPSFKDVGTYRVWYKVTIDENYNDYESYTDITINKKDINITIDNKQINYGDSEALLTFSSVGLADNDSLSNVTLTRETGSNVGNYKISINIDENSNKNYNINVSNIDNAVYTINPKVVLAPNIVIDNSSIIYTGKEINQKVILKDEEGNIIPEIEYILEYENNIDKGTATIKIKNKEGGNYVVPDLTTTFEIVDAGIIEINDSEDKNVYNTKLEEISKDIVSKIKFTDEELKVLDFGKNINIFLVVTDITYSIDENEKEIINKSIDGDAVVGSFLDITLFKQIDNEDAVKITETSSPVTVSFEIPEKDINKDEKIKRTYRIVRIHND